MMRGSAGLTLLEALIALAVVGVVLTALAYVQVGNVRGAATSRAASVVKTEGNRVLERVFEEVVFVDDSDPANPVFEFDTYYQACGPSSATPGEICSGDQSDALLTGFDPDPSVTTLWAIRPAPGTGPSSFVNEGVLTITVTSVHDRGARITLGSAISCFDVYPSPSANTPDPCPAPASP